MATSKELLLETLEHLGDEELKRFKWFLLQADILEGFPPIPRSRLERADRLDTVDQMVQIYNQHTPEVTMKVLMKINRNDLVQALRNTSSAPRASGSSAAASGVGTTVGASGSSAAASAVGTTVGGKHFVDKYQDELIQKVSMVEPILDKLLTKNVIKQEGCDNVTSKSTTQKQMRELYKLLKTKKGKDIFYDILEQEENLLMDELKENE
ncbi:apoptosis-associated speck-like protein containing a CARD [Centroberyx gerrardi]